MAALTNRLVCPFFVWLLASSAARAQPAPAAVETDQECKRMLLDAAAALRNEQYPSMAQIAAERQQACPGADSLFLLGIARSNMIHKGLVARENEALVRAQAIYALTTALDSGAVRDEWLQPANAWLQWLRRAEHDQTRSEAASPSPQTLPRTIVPPAADPFEQEPSHLGPLLLASAGIGLLGAGVVTAIISGSRSPYDASPTLDTATDVLVLSGGAALVAALTWHLLTPSPTERVQISASTTLSRTAATVSLRLTF